MEKLLEAPTPLPTTPLRTARLTLRPWSDEDIPELYRICQDPDIQHWTTVPSPYRVEDAEFFVRELTPKGFLRGTEATYGVFLTDTGTIAASISLRLLAERGDLKTGEIGFWASPDTRGRGYMTEAVLALVRWGFEEQGFERIIWQAYDGNAASRRVAEKAGFTLVGIQRGSHRVRGARIDMLLADILPGELPAGT